MDALSIITTASLLVLILILAFAVYYNYAFYYWKRKNVRFLRPSFPYGNFGKIINKEISFGEGFAEFYNKGKALSENYVGVYSLTKPLLVAIDPTFVKSVLLNDFANFHGRGFYYNESIDPLNAHLVNLSGPKWKRMRSKLSPTFTAARMKHMFSTLAATSRQIEEAIEQLCSKSEPVNVGELMQKLTTDNIGSTVFGLNCNSFKDPDSQFRKYAKLYFATTLSDAFKFMLSKAIPSVFDFLKIPIIRPEVTNFFMRTFKDIVDHRIQSGEYRKDFIDLFIRLKNNENLTDDNKEINNEKEDIKNLGNITFNKLAAQAFSFFLAGFETSSSTLTFCAYELAFNNSIQNKLRTEILEVLARYNGELTYDGIMEMTYLDNVLSETLRKYPPLPLLNRQCNEDYVSPHGDLSLEKGDEVWISVLGLHRDPAYYVDPEVFDPERFNEVNKVNILPFTYLPFGDGPRNCIGLRFGMFQVKVGLVLLLKAHKYTLNPKTQSPLILSPKGVFLDTKEKIWLDVMHI